MFKFTLYLLLISISFTKFDVLDLTKEKLENLKLYADYQHHFIFFHKPMLDKIINIVQNWEATDIKFYINDCRKNALPECDHPELEPVVLLFNRILIRFNGDPSSPDQIVEWAQRRILSTPKYINSRQQLDGFLATSPNSFCFCQPPDQIEMSGYFYILSKSLPHQSFCILNNLVTYTQIGLKQNNFTLFLNNATNRREFQHPNRFQSWQAFVKVNMLPSIPRANSLVGQRFAHKQKNIDIYVLICDFGLKCDKVWENARGLQNRLNKNQLGYDFYITLQDQRQSTLFYLYYHYKINLNALPALAHISLKGEGGSSGQLSRQIQYINEFSNSAIDAFITKVQKGQAKDQYFSATLPKNNGFYGKGSQKFVQKLVASNALKVIESSQKHYVLLITALGIACEACQNFYKQFKQIASLLIDKDITFGILNVNQNQVPFKFTTQLPDLFLIKKQEKDSPIRLEVNHSFDHLMLFFKNNLGSAYSNPYEL